MRQKTSLIAIHPLASLCIALVLGFSSACQDPSEACVLTPIEVEQDILFLGHTYQWGFDYSNRIDHRLERLDFMPFSQIWLGGDITSQASAEYETLQYLDDLFDLGDENTHWSWGNHDVYMGHPEWIMAFTGRNSYYTHHKDGLTIMVLNTSLGREGCEALESQYEMIVKVTDSIKHSSHLVILMHIVAWSAVEPGMEAGNAANAANPWLRFRCDIPRLFDNAIWPKLKKVQERGVQVVVISGDAGKKEKFYQYQTKEGAWFLASGINNSQVFDRNDRNKLPRDQVLLLSHDKQARSLEWEFVELLDILPQCQ